MTPATSVTTTIISRVVGSRILQTWIIGGCRGLADLHAIAGGADRGALSGTDRRGGAAIDGCDDHLPLGHGDLRGAVLRNGYREVRAAYANVAGRCS